jgi:predicted enzyme related to lactoylglutathione lyase
MADSSDIGRFVWHELMTTDPQGAIAFYTDVVGWKTQAWEGGDYTMWVGSDGRPLGGVSALPERVKKVGGPPSWTSNVLVGDVDATVATARKLDGKVHVEPTDIPTVGRFAVLGDPQGATISVFKWASPMPAPDPSKPGQFSWAELSAANHETALPFYTALFGWQKLREFDMGPMGKYVIFGLGGKDLGGMLTKGKDGPPTPFWKYYIEVAGIDAAAERAKAKGGKVLVGPMDVPGGARVAHLRDPQGVAITLHENKKS